MQLLSSPAVLSFAYLLYSFHACLSSSSSPSFSFALGRYERQGKIRSRKHNAATLLPSALEKTFRTNALHKRCHDFPSCVFPNMFRNTRFDETNPLYRQNRRQTSSSPNSLVQWGDSHLKQGKRETKEKERFSPSHFSEEALGLIENFRCMYTPFQRYTDREGPFFTRTARCQQKGKTSTSSDAGEYSSRCRAKLSVSCLKENKPSFDKPTHGEPGSDDSYVLSEIRKKRINRRGRYLPVDGRASSCYEMMDTRKVKDKVKKTVRGNRCRDVLLYVKECIRSPHQQRFLLLSTNVVAFRNHSTGATEKVASLSPFPRCIYTGKKCTYISLKNGAMFVSRHSKNNLKTASFLTGIYSRRSFLPLSCHFSGCSGSSPLLSPVESTTLSDTKDLTSQNKRRRRISASPRQLTDIRTTQLGISISSIPSISSHTLHRNKHITSSSSSLLSISSSPSSVSRGGPRLCIFFPKGTYSSMEDSSLQRENSHPSSSSPPPPPPSLEASPKPSVVSSAPLQTLTGWECPINSYTREGDLFFQYPPNISPTSLPDAVKHLLHPLPGGICHEDVYKTFSYPDRQVPFIFYLHSLHHDSSDHGIMKIDSQCDSFDKKKNSYLETNEESVKPLYIYRHLDSTKTDSTCPCLPPPPLGLPIVYTSLLLPPSFPRDHPLQPQKLARLFSQLMEDSHRHHLTGTPKDRSYRGSDRRSNTTCGERRSSAGCTCDGGEQKVRRMKRRDPEKEKEENGDKETAHDSFRSPGNHMERWTSVIGEVEGSRQRSTGDGTALPDVHRCHSDSLCCRDSTEERQMLASQDSSPGLYLREITPIHSKEKLGVEQGSREFPGEGRERTYHERNAEESSFECGGEQRKGKKEKLGHSSGKKVERRGGVRLYSNSDTSLFLPVVDEKTVRSWLRTVHTPEYVAAAASATLPEREQRKVGLPVTKGYVWKSLAEVSCTVLASWIAVQFGMACVVGGGTHHAKAAEGGKFCLFNDVATAARLALLRKAAARIVILDLDVHQGDGTAEIFQGDPNIITVSVHCEDNFPFPKAKSRVDVGLPSGSGDEEYLYVLDKLLPAVLLKYRPSLMFYVAGVDVHCEDKLGNLLLTDDGLRRREELVFQHCLEYNRQRLSLHTSQRTTTRHYEVSPSQMSLSKGEYMKKQNVRALLNNECINWQLHDTIDALLPDTQDLHTTATVDSRRDVVPRQTSSTGCGREGLYPPVGVCCVVAGGYSDDVEETVKRHMNLFNAAKHFWFKERYGAFYFPPQHLHSLRHQENVPPG
ncbi:histone deacetylase hdac4 [Cystoisospora suis]|uniref:Histone deacetylase hdac4 n=1 Tax=Cystoisospora suis TaxID=483139 RepID=A0A2C6L1W2_9APIC|nr:histone deacetylase hdac4 [Cystoisospora suis]